MPSKSERLLILERLEKEEINPHEAARLLSQKTTPAPPEHSGMGILDKVDRGEISATEAAGLLARGGPGDNLSEERTGKIDLAEDKAFEPARMWGWWAAPILLGIALIVGSGLLMKRDLADGQLGLAFLCAWAPLAVGMFVVILGWSVRKGPWLHFRANSHNSRRHANLEMRLPVPLSVARAYMQGFGVKFAGFDQPALDKLQESLAEARRRGEPVHIRTTSDDGGDAMDIYVS